MILEREAFILRDLSLTPLDRFVHKFLRVPAPDVHDMVVVAAAIQFENRMFAVETVALYEADRLAILYQRFLDALSTDMPFLTGLQDLENLYSWQSDLKPRLPY